MSDAEVGRGLGARPDPIAVTVDQATRQGWRLTPTISFGKPVPALIRSIEGIAAHENDIAKHTTDVVTLPLDGPCEVYRVVGGPSRDRPRNPGEQQFRHIVPLVLALRWVLFDAPDDEMFVEWARANYDIPDPPQT